MLVKNINFLNNSNKIVKSYKMTSLPFKEPIIISKSIEFFNDPEPCFIHRSAVMKRLLAEIDDYLYKISQSGVKQIKLSDFREKFGDSLETETDVESVQFTL